MRILYTTPSLLCALLIEQSSAFGLSPPLSQNNNVVSRPDSSLYAIDAVVEAIASGGSALADVAAAAAASIVPVADSVTNTAASRFSPELLSIDIETVASGNPVPGLDQIASLPGLSPDSAPAVGTSFGVGGFLVGALSSGGGKKGEAKRLENIIKEKSKEIENLNATLVEAEAKNVEIKTNSEEAIDKMENQIFVMDQEFEESTEVLKQDFEKRVQREILNRGDKIEQDLKFKYDIQLMREREQMLQEKLKFVSEESSSSSLVKQEETALAKLELVETRSTIATLQSNLSRSENENQELRTMIEEGKNPFNTAGFRLQVADLKNDMSGMESALIEKEQQIEDAKRELEDLKTKRSNPLYFVKEIFQ